MSGKGSKPRNCFSKIFRANYEGINWGNLIKDTGIDKNIMNKSQELIIKYNLAANSYYPNTKNPYKNRDPEIDKICSEKEAGLIAKYKNRIGEGWYGFSFGCPTPILWFTVIDEFLDFLFSQNSDAVIHQIKLKMGFCVIYVSNLTDEEKKMCRELEGVLFDKKLIY